MRSNRSSLDRIGAFPPTRRPSDTRVLGWTFHAALVEFQMIYTFVVSDLGQFCEIWGKWGLGIPNMPQLRANN